MTDLKFEVGKMYVTKCGSKAMFLDRDTYHCFFYHYHEDIDMAHRRICHDSDGCVTEPVNENLDIIGEYREVANVFYRWLCFNDHNAIGDIKMTEETNFVNNIPVKITIPKVGKATVEMREE